MNNDYFTLNISHNIKKKNFKLDGDIKDRDSQEELIDTFLRNQIGAEKDKSNPNIRKEYSIQLRWYPRDDIIKVSSNTGNKGLRDGILLYALKNLEEKCNNQS